MKPPKTIRTTSIGKRELRLVQKGSDYFGLADGKILVQGHDPDEVWKNLHKDVGKADPAYFGYAGARARFLKFFPRAFCSVGYDEAERNYKLAAKQRLDATAPLDRAVSDAGLGEPVLAAFRATNLLSPFEKTRLQDLLRGPSADTCVNAIARFAAEGTEARLREVERVLKPHDCAKWTIATYLPFLWRPEAHMFLKPTVTKDFAARVGHAFGSDYNASVAYPVYQSLLDLVSTTERELSDLTPRDRIDIQSFIWIVGAYTEEQPVS